MSRRVVLGETEIRRLYDLAKWGRDVKGLKDPDFLSALDKLEGCVMNGWVLYRQVDPDRDTSGSEYLRRMTAAARQLLEDRIAAGKKNIYHSMMSVIDGKYKKGTFTDPDTEFREYASRYELQKSELEPAKEIFMQCYATYQKKKAKRGDQRIGGDQAGSRSERRGSTKELTEEN